MKAVVAAFNQEKALVGAFSVITNLRMELFEALEDTGDSGHLEPGHQRGVAAHHVQLRAGPHPGPAHLILSEYNVPSITRTSIMQS